MGQKAEAQRYFKQARALNRYFDTSLPVNLAQDAASTTESHSLG
jgi:hypothetical protein